MRHLFIIFMMFGFFSVYGQNGTHYISVKAGVGVRGIYSGSISYDYSTKYYNQHEIFGEFIESHDTGYRTMMGGLVIKPVQVRGVNSAIRWRLGAGLGTDFNRIVVAPQVGWEVSQTFKNRIELIFENKNQVVLGAPMSERWRFMIDLGIRILLN